MPAGATGRVFVGRERELAELRTALAAATAGAGQLVLLAGDAGVGKTSLGEVLAGEAQAVGAAVLWGRCWEGGGAPPYWPWTQVLRSYLAEREVAAHLVEQLGAIVPELSTARAGRPVVQGDEGRFALLAAVAELIAEASRDSSVVLLLDDLHAADPPSLALLEYLARELRGAPVLLVGLYRELEAQRRPVVSQMLGRLAASGVTLPLRGLSTGEIAALLPALSGVAVAPQVAEAIRSATAGNPFLAGQLARLLAAEGQLQDEPLKLRAESLPIGVRQAIERRLSFVSEAARSLLRGLAVVGPEFSTGVAEALAGLSYAQVAALLAEAEGADLVRPSATAGRWTFDHALLAEGLYASLDAGARLDLHRRAGAALEALYAEDLDAHAGELAHHFLAAGEPQKVVEYARRAGGRARELFAHEEAARYYETALDALPAASAGDDALRLGLLLDLAEAQRAAGRTQLQRATSLEAAGLARSLARPAALAQAALLLAADDWATFTWQSDEVVREHLVEALDALGTSEGPLRIRLLGRLAQELQFAGDPSRTRELAEDALGMARRLGDPAVLAEALIYSHAAMLGTEHPEPRARVAAELVELGETSGRLDISLRGHAAWVPDALELADVRTVDREIAAVARLGERLGLPSVRWQVTYWHAMRALLDGHVGEAERLATEARDAGLPIFGPIAEVVYLTQLLQIRWWQAAGEDILPPLEAAAAASSDYTARAMLASLYMVLGRAVEARRHLERFAPADFARLPVHHSWHAAMMLFAWVAARVGDVERAAALHDVLLPTADRHAVGGAAVSSLGPVATTLGVTAAVTGDLDAAVAHLEDGVRSAQSAGATAYAAWAQVELAGVLVQRHRGDDDARAGVLLEQARDTARQLGLDMVLARIEEVVAAAPEDRVWAFRREGDVWAVGSGSSVVRVRDTKGMRYLARLLERPNVEIPALELVHPDSGVLAQQQADAGVGELLDRRAKILYRERMRDLEAAIEQAERFNDPEQAAQARREMEFLRREVARAVGLGGRDRRTGTAAERARLNVTRAVKDAVARIAAEQEQVGPHLQATIRTGRTCIYLPGADQPRWDVRT